MKSSDWTVIKFNQSIVKLSWCAWRIITFGQYAQHELLAPNTGQASNYSPWVKCCKSTCSLAFRVFYYYVDSWSVKKSNSLLQMTKWLSIGTTRFESISIRRSLVWLSLAARTNLHIQHADEVVKLLFHTGCICKNLISTSLSDSSNISFRFQLSITMNRFIDLAPLVAFGLFALLTIPPTSLFEFHPFLMSVGMFLLLPSGIHLLRKSWFNTSSQPRVGKVSEVCCVFYVSEHWFMVSYISDKIHYIDTSVHHSRKPIRDWSCMSQTKLG